MDREPIAARSDEINKTRSRKKKKETTDSSSPPPVDQTEASKASDKVFHCNVCGIDFELKRRLQEHHAQVHVIRNHHCSFCNNSYVAEIQLERHIMTHTKETTFQCQNCKKLFPNQKAKTYHTKHERCVTKKKVMNLPGISSMKTVQRNSACLNRDSELKELFSCDVCGIRFAREIGLKTHHQRIHGVKLVSEYNCSICLKHFKCSKSLKRHSATHEEKQFHCQNCEKSFLSTFTLQTHIRLGVCQRDKSVKASNESEPETFTCKYCPDDPPRTFTSQRGLRNHKLRKHGVDGGPYLCLFCNDGKRWHSHGHLQIHLVTHTKEKHFQCPLCKKRFGTKAAMTAHMNRKSCLLAAGLTEAKMVEGQTSETTSQTGTKADLPASKIDKPVKRSRARRKLTDEDV